MSSLETYAVLAPKLFDAGYEVLPILPNQKRPNISGWTTMNFRDRQILDHYIRQCPHFGVGVKTGDVVIIDIDCPRGDLAIEFQDRCFSMLGEAPVRIGKAPKRALCYRIDGEPLDKKATKKYELDGTFFQVEVLGQGQQCVIYGVHPNTNAPYHWVGDSLEHLPFDQLVPVTEEQIDKLLREFCDRLGQVFGKELIPQPQELVPSSVLLPTKLSNEDPLLDALSYLDPQRYDEWVSIGLALKTTGRVDAAEIFQSWSAKRPDGSVPSNYRGPEDTLAKFHKFRPERTSVASIFSKASRGGWRDTRLLQLTDLGNGERLVRDWGNEIVFCSDQKAWYAWSDKHWEMCDQKVKQYAKNTTRKISTEASGRPDLAGDIIKWQKTSESVARQSAMLETASSDPEISRPFDLFLKDSHLFNVQNGTFELNKQILREHRQSDHITKLANASLQDNSVCPRWIRFIDEITNEDAALALFLKKFCGYMLSGDRTEQIILFLVGEGANGKSVFLDVLKHVFGSYAGVISAKALVDRNASSIPSDIAALANKRFVMLSEFPEHAAINTATVKSITGGDEITARHLYKEWFEFKPQFQVVCALNNLPKLTWVDAAFFRRVRIIPFERIFTPDQRNKALQAELKAEADGILKWIVEGYQLYRSEGLEATPKMLAFLDEYMTNEDPVAQFVESYVDGASEKEFIPVQTMLGAIDAYCRRQGIETPVETQTRKRLRELLGATFQRRYGHHQDRTRGFVGYTIIEDRDDEVCF